MSKFPKSKGDVPLESSIPEGTVPLRSILCTEELHCQQPDLAETREAALEMAKDIRRAADIIDRVRFLYQKGSSKSELVDINEVVQEMLAPFAW